MGHGTGDFHAGRKALIQTRQRRARKSFVQYRFCSRDGLQGARDTITVAHDRGSSLSLAGKKFKRLFCERFDETEKTMVNGVEIGGLKIDERLYRLVRD